MIYLTLSLKVGIKFSWITFVAPNAVIGKQLLYSWIWVKKYLESDSLPETYECSASGGGTNGVNLTWPLAQHHPSASFLNLNALQYWHATFIGPNSNDLLWTVINFHVIIESGLIGVKCNISMFLISIPSIPFSFILRFALLVSLTCSCIPIASSVT